MNHPFIARFALASASALVLLMAGCAAPSNRTASSTLPPAPVVQAPAAPPEAPMGVISDAESPVGYRLEAAYHLYDRNSARIFKGVMPHFLYAIGVLEVRVDQRGNVASLNWLRAPEHAPEVVAEIERTVRTAAPFPAPVRMGSASYIETWLWDASGNFQLHTLSEGQGPKGQGVRKMPADPRAVRVVAAPGLPQ